MSPLGSFGKPWRKIVPPPVAGRVDRCWDVVPAGRAVAGPQLAERVPAEQGPAEVGEPVGGLAQLTNRPCMITLSTCASALFSWLLPLSALS